jgi:hypothetical protein
MSTQKELLTAIRYVGDRTGDPNAWQSGLTPDEVAAVANLTTKPSQLDAILAKIRQQHSELFGGPAGAPRTPVEPQQGDAAEAIAAAEAALAHQSSATSQLDLQVISAILNAHLRTVAGSEALTRLQQETEAAVRTRSDLDTPAGARDFQRFLINKLRDIRAVVANTSLDDTSKSALMAAWTSLYNASKTGPAGPSEQRPGSPSPDAVPARGPSRPPAAQPGGAGFGGGRDPYFDPLLLDDPGLLSGDPPTQGAAAGPTAAAMPTAPMMPSIPNFGAGQPSGGGATPGAMAGWSAPGGLPLSRLLGGGPTDQALSGLDDERQLGLADEDSRNHDDPGDHKGAEDKEASADKPQSLPAGPTTVTLPDGETVTAANPQLAAVIKAAVGGTSIPDAFHQQGITIPPAGTAVANPIDPLRVAPGDVGIFTDRHALALGHAKALLDGQIQHIATVTGPSFLGWEHPPEKLGPTSAPARTEPPTPTRPATASTT